MKHIKEILSNRKSTLFATRQDTHRQEKGSREWSAFNAIRGDQIEMFPVATPRARSTPRYANTIHISRQPRHLTPYWAR